MREKASFYQNILGVKYIFQPFQMNVYGCSVSGETELILMDIAARLEDFHAAFEGQCGLTSPYLHSPDTTYMHTQLFRLGS